MPVRGSIPGDGFHLPRRQQTAQRRQRGLHLLLQRLLCGCQRESRKSAPQLREQLVPPRRIRSQLGLVVPPATACSPVRRLDLASAPLPRRRLSQAPREVSRASPVFTASSSPRRRVSGAQRFWTGRTRTCSMRPSRVIDSHSRRQGFRNEAPVQRPLPATREA